MNKYNSNSNERGVVLITCLIFLILLLTLMRFTIGSAKMSELKVGADLDEMSAQTAADLTFEDVEHLLRRVDANGVSLQDNTLNLADNESSVTALALDYWEDANNFNNISGIYDGDANPCTDQLCINHVNVNNKPDPDNPLAGWILDCNNPNKKFICFGEVTGNEQQAVGQGKYVIERFLPEGNILNINFAGASTRAVIFRVTGIGYSQAGNANATDVVRQNTYILTYDPSIK